MPIYAAVFLLFTMGNVGLPGTSGFVGEFLTMQGVFNVDPVTATIAASGVILSAAYMLTLYRKIVFGPLENPALSAIKDMNAREILIFVPLIVAALVLGFYPALIFDQTATSAVALVDAFHANFK
jgi:NADH-quinone oxidoreductase subunit M